MIPTYIPTSEGDLFAVVHSACNSGAMAAKAHSNWVMLLPPLAEELNKSRKIIADQARLWAHQGVSVLLPDYAATGDSSGSLSTISWSQWRQQMLEALQWLQAQGCQNVILWGVRVGALMAADLARELNQKNTTDTYPSLTSLLLWQPVVSGKLWLTQLLRLRIASQLMSTQAVISSNEYASPRRESVADLRQQLDAGSLIEVAGYCLSSKFTESLDKLKLDVLLREGIPAHVDWLEVNSALEPVLTPISNRLVSELVQTGLSIRSQCVSGDSFWSTQEICRVPALLQLSETLIESAVIEWARVAARNNISHGISSTKNSTSLSIRACYSETTVLTPVVFSCQGDELIGVVHNALQPQPLLIGVVIVVGGPQYRVGCHRQFYQLADYLAAQGIPVLRFDCRGMGDSEGDFDGFDRLDADIGAAIDALKAHFPQLQNVVLWGLCDGATAASFYALSDLSIVGLVLLNPWVRSEAGEAKAYLKYYYLQRFFSRSLWNKVFSGSFSWRSSLQALRSALIRALGGVFNRADTEEQLLETTRREIMVNVADGQDKFQRQARGYESSHIIDQQSQNLVTRLGRSLLNFRGKTLVILSGNDLTAAEYSDALQGKNALAKASIKPNYESRRFDEADHTFSRTAWKQQVAQWTLAWIKTL